MQWKKRQKKKKVLFKSIKSWRNGKKTKEEEESKKCTAALCRSKFLGCQQVYNRFCISTCPEMYFSFQKEKCLQKKNFLLNNISLWTTLDKYVILSKIFEEELLCQMEAGLRLHFHSFLFSRQINKQLCFWNSHFPKFQRRKWKYEN